jgi:hypothetical protein
MIFIYDGLRDGLCPRRDEKGIFLGIPCELGIVKSGYFLIHLKKGVYSFE